MYIKYICPRTVRMDGAIRWWGMTTFTELGLELIFCYVVIFIYFNFDETNLILENITLVFNL